MDKTKKNKKMIDKHITKATNRVSDKTDIMDMVLMTADFIAKLSKNSGVPIISLVGGLADELIDSKLDHLRLTGGKTK